MVDLLMIVQDLGPGRYPHPSRSSTCEASRELVQAEAEVSVSRTAAGERDAETGCEVPIELPSRVPTRSAGLRPTARAPGGDAGFCPRSPDSGAAPRAVAQPRHDLAFASPRSRATEDHLDDERVVHHQALYGSASMRRLAEHDAGGAGAYGAIDENQLPIGSAIPGADATFWCNLRHS
jgi:hypothetical protein